MKLAVREDGMVLNLSAVLIFTPRSGNKMVVELPGDQHYVIYNFSFFELVNDDVHYKEWGGWPE